MKNDKIKVVKIIIHYDYNCVKYKYLNIKGIRKMYKMLNGCIKVLR